MYTPKEKQKENKNQSVTKTTNQEKNSDESTFQFADKRFKSIAQQQMQEMANDKQAVVIQRQVYGSSDDGITPWALLGDWVNEGVFEQFPATVRRIAVGDGNGVSEDCDIEFAWTGTYFYDGQGYIIKAHLHVRNGAAVIIGGGIWAEGLYGSGVNWNELGNYNYLLQFMTQYVE
jgi:hypothetical protein